MTFRLAHEDEKLKADSLALRLSLSSKRYDLIDEAAYRRHYSNPDMSMFVIAVDASQEIRACMRLDTPYDLRQYTTFTVPVSLPPRVVGDIGVYLDRASVSPVAVLRDLWAFACRISDYSELTHLYGQVQERYVRGWVRLGCEVVTSRFSVQGWRGRWLGLLLDLGQMRRSPCDPALKMQWSSRYGCRLHVEFWRRVEELLGDPKRWHLPGSGGQPALRE